MDHISIIIVHYNSDKETRDCLDSLSRIEVKSFTHSVIVVDNASKKPLKLPQSLLEHSIEILRSESNLGFTGGNNLGMKHAIEKHNSEYVVLLNSDTVVEPHFLERLYQCMKQETGIGLLTPKIYFAKNYEFHRQSYTPAQRGTVLWYAGGTIDWANLTAFHRGVDEVDRGQFDTQKHSDFATGCCVMITREVLELIGGFDDRYFLYLEDVDLSVRARQRGFKIGFCAESVVWHKNAGSTGGSGSHLHQYYQSRNRLWFAFRYGTWKIKLTAVRLAATWLINGNNLERRAVVDLLFGRLGKQFVL